MCGPNLRQGHLSAGTQPALDVHRPHRRGRKRAMPALPNSCHKPTHAAQQDTPLFADLVGELLKVERHFEAERLGSLKIDAQLKLDRLRR
jgi:hypothetical protein